MVEKTEGTIALLNVKIAKKEKEAFFAECKRRGVTPSTVTRKLIAMWMADEIKLEI